MPEKQNKFLSKLLAMSEHEIRSNFLVKELFEQETNWPVSLPLPALCVIAEQLRGYGGYKYCKFMAKIWECRKELTVDYIHWALCDSTETDWIVAAVLVYLSEKE